MNLQNLQVRELTSQEEREIEGGGLGDLIKRGVNGVVRHVYRAYRTGKWLYNRLT